MYSRLYEQELCAYERPIALQTSMVANQGRDPKKQKKAFTPDDFSYYVPKDQRDLPDGAYGAAAKELANHQRFPSWALFCWRELICNSDDTPPRLLSLQCKDAILLAPQRTNDGWRGMLIAQESASNKRRVFTDDHGREYALTVPFVSTKIIAQENATLTS